MTITLNGTTGITTPDVTSDGLTVDSTTLVVDEANNRVGIGTSSPTTRFEADTGAGGTQNIATLRTTNVQLKIGTTDIGNGEVYYNVFPSSNSSAAGAHIWQGGGTERARIDSSGNLLVGTTSNSAYATGFSVRDAATGANTSIGHPSGTPSGVGYVLFGYNGGGIGSITQNGTTAVSYNTSSDYRLKEDWQPMTGASERVKALNPVNFAWKADGSRVDGFLAHEAQAVVPEAVTGEKDAVELVDIKDEVGNVTGQEERPVYQGIDQSKLVPLLTAALQEALAEIETLKARVSALEATNV